jgi:hypothetical protein
MGHIVFGAPGSESYHLHRRLQGALEPRGHRISVLTLDAAAHTFWRHQLDHGEIGIGPLRPNAADRQWAMALGPGVSGRHGQHLAGLLRPLRAWFAAERPSLVLLHRRRGAEACLLQRLAHEFGCRVLWTGDGLLPHTLQIDERGLDGDAAASRRPARDYRVVPGDRSLLRACLSHALARNLPVAAEPGGALPPPWSQRLHDLPAMWRSHGLRAALQSWSAWRTGSSRRKAQVPGPTAWLPPAPFVAVLLQHPTDARLRLDADAAPSQRALLDHARLAAAAIDPELAIAAIAPDDHCRRPHWLARDIAWLPASAGIDAAAVAAATATVNHPLASIALLAGTPVLHCGRALYGLPGVGTFAPLAEWPAALARTLRRDHPRLRERFLSWVFGYGHVWCSATHPDHNGMLGLVQAIEARLEAPPEAAPLRYRRGPAWPLAAEGRSG